VHWIMQYDCLLLSFAVDVHSEVERWFIVSFVNPIIGAVVIIILLMACTVYSKVVSYGHS